MVACASRSEYLTSRRAVWRTWHAAERRIRFATRDGSHHGTEVQLLWTVEHGAVVPPAVREEAESILLGFHGAMLWSTIEEHLSWRRVPDAFQEGLAALLIVMRSGSLDAGDLRRHVRRLGFEVACWSVVDDHAASWKGLG
jgi:hypothetical protein